MLRSIRGRLAAAMVAVVAVTLVVGFTVVIVGDTIGFRQDLVANSVVMARVIGEYSVVTIRDVEEEEDGSRLDAGRRRSFFRPSTISPFTLTSRKSWANSRATGRDVAHALRARATGHGPEIRDTYADLPLPIDSCENSCDRLRFRF